MSLICDLQTGSSYFPRGFGKQTFAYVVDGFLFIGDSLLFMWLNHNHNQYECELLTKDEVLAIYSKWVLIAIVVKTVLHFFFLCISRVKGCVKEAPSA